MKLILSEHARRSEAIRGQKEQQQQKRPLIPFYQDTPTVELTLDEFELFAIKRLKVS